jgi:hypothetical protein
MHSAATSSHVGLSPFGLAAHPLFVCRTHCVFVCQLDPKISRDKDKDPKCAAPGHVCSPNHFFATIVVGAPVSRISCSSSRRPDICSISFGTLHLVDSAVSAGRVWAQNQH